jgi:predicted metal-dependent hydrolase
MAFKQFTIGQNTPVTIYKTKKSRHLRISLNTNGDVRVSIPSWVSYEKGYAFAVSQQGWILDKRKSTNVLKNGGLIGKAHHLHFIPTIATEKAIAKINGNNIIVKYPTHLRVDYPEVQSTARKACIRALRKQSEMLLPQRLNSIAGNVGLSYHDISVKALKGRWGSCDQNKHIVLNLYLMQLPWEYIDYVIKHELTHTRYMNHGIDFWNLLTSLEPRAKEYRRSIKQFQPVVLSL